MFISSPEQTITLAKSGDFQLDGNMYIMNYLAQPRNRACTFTLLHGAKSVNCTTFMHDI